MPRPDNAVISRSITSYVTSAVITRRLLRTRFNSRGEFTAWEVWLKTALLWQARVRNDWGW